MMAAAAYFHDHPMSARTPSTMAAKARNTMPWADPISRRPGRFPVTQKKNRTQYVTVSVSATTRRGTSLRSSSVVVESANSGTPSAYRRYSRPLGPGPPWSGLW
ncbi:MAG TPA: hypothetical protein VGF00_11060 [Acidimicrobiia bacterium]